VNVNNRVFKFDRILIDFEIQYFGREQLPMLYLLQLIFLFFFLNFKAFLRFWHLVYISS